MQTPPINEMPAKKNNTPIIITAVAIVLCCCCAILAIAGYYGYNNINNTEDFFPPPTEEAVPVIPEATQEATQEFFGTPGAAPSGGLGNDILRNDTWTYVAAAAQGQGCDQPLGEDTTIDVLQEPQDGVWVEQWNVACASGETYSYEIEFTLDNTGTTFDIKPLQ